MKQKKALFNMIEQQIRPLGVSDPRVLQALNDLPRESFLPDTHAGFSYVDTDLPLIIEGKDTGVRLLAPSMMARLLQSADIQKDESVAQFGLGDGYLTAILAGFSKIVTVYEVNESIITYAQNNLNRHGVRNVNYELINGLKYGMEKFDVLLLTGSVDFVVDSMLQKIHVGGRIIAVIGAANSSFMQAVLIERAAETNWKKNILFETTLPALYPANYATNFNF